MSIMLAPVPCIASIVVPGALLSAWAGLDLVCFTSAAFTCRAICFSYEKGAMRGCPRDLLLRRDTRAFCGGRENRGGVGDFPGGDLGIVGHHVQAERFH